MKNKLLVLDIETTGFNHKDDCILELGIVELDLKTGEIKTLFDEQFQELHLRAKHLNAWIFENKFMKHEDVRGKKDIKEHASRIQLILDLYKDRVTAWNRPFDIDFLTSRGFDFGKELDDPMRVSTEFFKIPFKNNYKPGFVSADQNYKWASAQEAWDTYR